MKIGDKVFFKRDAPEKYPKRKIFIIDCFMNWTDKRTANIHVPGNRFNDIKIVNIKYLRKAK
jgi:hypothetical protein